jgi:ribosome-binding factor A
MTSRNQRVADSIREDIARILREDVRDPDIGFTTVTEVDLSPDLRHARVFVSVLGGDEAATLRALDRAAPFIRRRLAHSAGLRFTPSLRFLGDRSAATGARVEDLLRRVRPPDEEENGEDSEPSR